MEQKEDKLEQVSLVQGGLIYSLILKIQGRFSGKNSLRNKSYYNGFTNMVSVSSFVNHPLF